MTKITQMSVENNGGDSGGQNRRRIHLREISGDSESPLETVGSELRAARLRRGDEIAQVSRALKIRKDHLEALEGDRLEDLPRKTNTTRLFLACVSSPAPGRPPAARW